MKYDLQVLQRKLYKKNKNMKTVKILLKVPENIYYPLKEARDKKNRTEKVLLHDYFIKLIEIGFNTIKPPGTFLEIEKALNPNISDDEAHKNVDNVVITEKNNE